MGGGKGCSFHRCVVGGGIGFACPPGEGVDGSFRRDAVGGGIGFACPPGGGKGIPFAGTL